ncbi:MAG: magnesium chelatase subunit D [Burkholderiaceae bacterium]|nr:magnesium chelatase subunit D [Burkholderiaceae bacterium]
MNLAWDDALWAAAALSIDPCGLRGVWLRAPHGPVRDEWLAQLTRLHPALRRVPGHADSERLLGGLDLGATLHAGRAIYQPGVLTQPDPTLLLLPMAERLPDDTAAILGQVLDQGQVPAGRQQTAQDTFIGLVALDESLEDEPPMAGGLQERLGIWLDLRHMGRAGGEDDNTRWMLDTLPSMDLSALRAHALHLDMEDAVVQAVCQTAHTLGVDSLRACLATVKLAKLLAALRGSDQVQEEDLGRAARLVLTPRATRAPVPPDQQAAPPEAEAQNDSPPDQPPPSDPPEQPPADPPPEPPGFDPQDMAELMLEAALATLPADVLALLADHKTAAPAGRGQGRSGNRKPSFLRGTPLPPRPGNPRQGARLHVLATLNAAVPRQKLRRLPSHSRAKLAIRTEDFHVHRYAEHSPTCLIFAIDASGSAALHRLAEAKGAVELLLTQSYARRDQVCVIGFRGTQAEVLLPPTKSLVRAKRSLSGLPGGGGTPLACAIEQCLQVALAEKRLGHSPSLVMLSDGRPNVSLQGQGGRAQALEDALTLAHVWRGHQLPAIWLDTSARPEPQAQQLAQAMGAHYVPLPMANSNRMAQAVQAVQSGNTPPATAIARAAWQPNAPSAQTPVWRNPGA